MSLPAKIFTHCTVIIPVHNSAEELHQCLAALASAAEVCEILVVDDASTDGSGDVARKMGARVIRLEEQGGPARARNAGAACTRSSILFFLDADVVPRPDTIRRGLEVLGSRPEADAVIGSYDDEPTCRKTVSLFRNLLHCFTHQTSDEEAVTFWAGCGAVRARCFQAVGGFDESWTRPSVEDIELGRRIIRNGGRIVLDADMQVKHLKRWTLAATVRCDTLDRGASWTRVIWSEGSLPNTLNLSWPQRISVACAALMAAAAAGSAWIGVLPSVPDRAEAALLFAGFWSVIALLNRRFYGFLLRKGGWRLVAAGVPLHLIHLLSGAAGFVIGSVQFLWSQWTLRPQPDGRGA